MTSQAVWREANPPVFGRGAPKRMLEHSLASTKACAGYGVRASCTGAGSVGSLWQFKVDLFRPHPNHQLISGNPIVNISIDQTNLHPSISGLTALSSPPKDDGNPSSVACIVPPRSLCSLANARLLSSRFLLAPSISRPVIEPDALTRPSQSPLSAPIAIDHHRFLAETSSCTRTALSRTIRHVV